MHPTLKLITARESDGDQGAAAALDGEADGIEADLAESARLAVGQLGSPA